MAVCILHFSNLSLASYNNNLLGLITVNRGFTWEWFYELLVMKLKAEEAEMNWNNVYISYRGEVEIIKMDNEINVKL